METLKLFKVLIGCTPKGRHTEQHDVFFGIAISLKALIPQLKAFWPEAADNMHLDAFREVTLIDNYKVSILPRTDTTNSEAQLFFINLGGYKPNEFDEFHYKMLVATNDKATAIHKAKETTFYKHTGYKGASSHVDDKYGVDVDDIYAIEDILAPALKEQYKIVLKKTEETLMPDAYKLGYFKLSKIEKGDFESE
jgi:Domain of Unknown Function (DUF1543)